MANNVAIYWFRKAQRLHDNPALNYALENSKVVYPVFILDPWFVKNYRIGPNRWRFLAQSLDDLNKSLEKKKSRLLVIRGQALPVLEEYMRKWKVDLLCFENDTEPYAKQRDAQVLELAKKMDVRVEAKWSHTLYDPHYLLKKNANKVCYTYVSMGALISKIGDPIKPVNVFAGDFPSLDGLVEPGAHPVPTLAELGVAETDCGPCLYPGGETEALRRLDASFKDESWVAAFEKPNTSPNSLKPSTTVLSPYFKFGNISARLFYYRLKDIYRKRTKHSKPPVSLEGQLLWREFFYFTGAFTPNFDKMVGNPICRQIDWDTNEEFFQAWRQARTGYPFIDAIMTQLRTEGWIHHLARHAVACFLTRGDLYQSWEKGVEVFEEWLLDADWSLNAANWMWLSASAFFHQYFRVYSPIAFGKKTDKNGDYIRKYLPVLKNYPTQYIYEPWTAPLSVQKAAKCVIGQDYPRPIVDHGAKSKLNIGRMKIAYEKNRVATGEDGDEGDDADGEDKKDVKPVVKSEPSVASTIKTPKAAAPAAAKSALAKLKASPSTPKQTTLDAFKMSPKTPQPTKVSKTSPPSPSTPSNKKFKKSD